MTGMSYPDKVVVTVGQRTLNGYGGRPETLLIGGVWQVERIAGKV